MRIRLIALLLIFSAVNILAERNNLKPADFEPLTSLPWSKPNATLDGVLNTIFREPNSAIRYPVLAEYLRTMPVAQLGKAFDICIALEGTQTPDNLVEFFLPIWAKRDPMKCWERTKDLFRVVGIEDWLTYDAWKERPRITVQDLSAIRASRFWLNNSSSLAGFPIGVDASSLPKKERLRLLKEFADFWFGAFGSWPGYPRVKSPWQYRLGYDDSDHDLIRMFKSSTEELRSFVTKGHYDYDKPAVEVALRRWLEAEPSSALAIIKTSREIKWTSYGGTLPQQPEGPSTELLMIWAKADLPAMIKWAESLDIRKDDVAFTVKGFLMSRVDAETREHWLAEAKSSNPEDDDTEVLLSDWAGWDPKAALDAAVATKNAEIIIEVVDMAAGGPFNGQPRNTSHFGLGVFKDFDPTRLPEDMHKNHFDNWEIIVTIWGEIDIGEAARYGLDFMLRTDYVPRENLIKLFSGDDKFASDGDMIDRTFCSLRVWAVVKPREMQAWIATLQDAEMRKALTWLLQHPWGTGPKE